MEGGSGGAAKSITSSWMAFGDGGNANCSSSSNGIHPYPNATMMPFMTPSSSSSCSSSCFNADHDHQNTASLYLPPTGLNYDHPRMNSVAPAMLQHHPLSHPTTDAAPGYFMDDNDGANTGNSSVKSKIMAHPHYHRLLAAYLNCQKVGAPAEVVARLEEACAAKVSAAAVSALGGCGGAGGIGMGIGGCIGEDPALDQFMEAYCEMLTKYHQELSKPFNDAMLFLSRVESQFQALAVSPPLDPSGCGEGMERTGSSEEELDGSNSLIDPQAEDRDLKVQLLRKYSGYLGSLKQEFMKKRKKGKLPKEARQVLLEWWSRHYKWPYPSESQKVALAEATGLDQKQINNWFINQRKRHWKPSEDMQLVVMEGGHPQPHYYMDHFLGANPYPSMDLSPSFL